MKLTDEIRADLNALRDRHGVAPIIIDALTTSRKDAGGALSLFKRMMFIANMSVITLGLCLAGFGFSKLRAEFSGVSLVILTAGALITFYFTCVFIRQVRAFKALMQVYKKIWH